MQTIALLLITVVSAAMNVSFPTIDETSRSVAIAIETNGGQVIYLAETKTIGDVSTKMSSFMTVLASSGLPSSDYELDYDSKNSIVSLYIEFENYKSFYDFNGINLTSEANRKIETKTSLFTEERTITLSDPYTRFLNPAKNQTAQILSDFNNLFNDGGKVDMGYIFASDFRRTKTNAPEHENNLTSGFWQYYYGVTNDPADAQEIVIFDRFANTPIWYGVAIVATGLFMGAFYLMSRKRVNKN